MDHREYIERYLSAHADDELNADENEAVSSHLATCAECRETLAVERATKAMIQNRVRVIPAPDALPLPLLSMIGAGEGKPTFRRAGRGWKARA